MPHLELQLVQVAVFGGVVAGEAVAAHILPPGACQAVPAGSLTHLAPVPQPLRRADALWGRAVGLRTQDFARLRVYVFNQSPLGKIFGTHVLPQNKIEPKGVDASKLIEL